MRTLVRRWAATVAAAVLAGVVASNAAAHSPDPIFTGDALWAQDSDLTFDWSSTQTPPTSMQTAIKAGAAGQNASRASRAATFRYLDGAGPKVAYGTDVVCGIGGLACMRRNPPVGFGLWFRENGHVFDWGTLRWCELYASPPDGCYEVENVTLDELGHVQILDHHVNFADDSDYLDAVVQTVSHAKPRQGWNAHAYGRCDVATLQKQYDVNTVTKYSTCLDLPAVASLTASQTSVPSDTQVRFTALLEVSRDTSVSYRLRGNDMDGRTLVLQRRPVGGVWTDYQVLPASGSPGGYAVTLGIRSTADWRVIFRKPADEGVRTAVSGTVRVTVTGPCTSAPCPLAAPGPLGAR